MSGLIRIEIVTGKHDRASAFTRKAVWTGSRQEESGERTCLSPLTEDQ